MDETIDQEDSPRLMETLRGTETMPSLLRNPNNHWIVCFKPVQFPLIIDRSIFVAENETGADTSVFV